MSVLARQRAALVAAIVLLTGCGARVSLGEYSGYPASPDDGTFEPDAGDPFDAEAIDALAETEPPDASDDAFDDAPVAD